MLTKDIKVGRLLARALDSFTPRTGTNTWHPMQRIMLLGPNGEIDSGRFICLISLEGAYSDEDRVRRFMKVLDTGIKYAEIEADTSENAKVAVKVTGKDGKDLFCITGMRYSIYRSKAIQLRDQLIRLLA